MTRSRPTSRDGTSRSTRSPSGFPTRSSWIPFDGAADLAGGRLRTPLSPEISFTDDPLRMLRAARFVARFGFTPDPELVAAVESLAPRLEIVSTERIRDELSKLLLVPDPSPGLWFLASTGLADHFLPELNSMELEQDPIHHHKDVLAHTIAVVAKTSPDLILRLAALMHDVGKPKTRSFERGRATFHHHEVVGARMTRDRLTRVAVPDRGRRRGDPAGVPAPADPHLRRWAGPTPRCAATCVTRATCSTGSTSCSAVTAPPGTSARRAPSAGGWTSSRSASRRSPRRRSCGRSGPRSTAGRSWSSSASRRVRSWARRWTSSSSPGSTRAPSTRPTPTRACAPGPTGVGL